MGFSHRLCVHSIQYTTAITTSVMEELTRLNQLIYKVCDQVMLLDAQIEELYVRSDRAAKVNKKAFRYSLQLRLVRDIKRFQKSLPGIRTIKGSRNGQD